MIEPEPSVDVVVVTYENASTARACVRPLVGAPELAVVVVDNASSDGTLEAVRDLPVRVVPLGENRGFGAGCNAGWRTGSAPAVLFLNPDAEASRRDVLALLDVLSEQPDVGIVAPRIVGEDGTLHPSLRRFPRIASTYAQALSLHRLFPHRPWVDELVREPDAYAAPHAVEWASGACLLVRRSLLEELDGFDERFFMYCEDTDLCRRAWNAGQRVVYTPESVVRHLGGRSAPRASLLPTLARSRRLYAEKHLGSRGAVAVRVGIALGSLSRALASLGAGARAVRRGHLGAAGAVLRPLDP